MGGSEPVACVEVLSLTPSFSTLTLTNNVCQGSDVNGFALPLVPCSMMSEMPYANNTAGSAKANGFILHQPPGGCAGFSGAKAYACSVGQIVNSAGTSQLRFSNSILADNGLAYNLRFGSSGTDSSAFVENMFATAISRPNCTECYQNGRLRCSGMQGVRMLAVTVNAEHYPGKFDTGFDTICKE